MSDKKNRLMGIDEMLSASTPDLGCYFDGKKPFVSECDSGDGIERTYEQCQAWAKHLGCSVRKPANDELFVDIDSEEAYKQFFHVWPLVKRHFAYHYVMTPSKSGLPKRHAVVRLVRKDHSLLEKIALQAALGSDGRREVISVVRAVKGEENVVVFFEPVEQEGKK
jgi:hypothetical protein